MAPPGVARTRVSLPKETIEASGAWPRRALPVRVCACPSGKVQSLYVAQLGTGCMAPPGLARTRVRLPV